MKSSLTLVIEQLVVDGKVVLHVMELAIALLLDVHLGHPVVRLVSGQVAAKESLHFQQDNLSFD